MAELIKVVGINKSSVRYCLIYLGHQLNSMAMNTGFESVEELERYALNYGIKKYVIVKVNSKEEQDKLDLFSYNHLLIEKFYKGDKNDRT